MLNKIDSSQNFGRKQDIPCVNQARTTLGNIYQKYVNTKLIEEDTFGDILLLDCKGGKWEPKSDFESAVFSSEEVNKTKDLASDGKVKNMTLLEVQELLKSAETKLKTFLLKTHSELKGKKINGITYKPFTSQQKEMLNKMKQQANANSLISIPTK